MLQNSHARRPGETHGRICSTASKTRKSSLSATSPLPLSMWLIRYVLRTAHAASTRPFTCPRSTREWVIFSRGASFSAVIAGKPELSGGGHSGLSWEDPEFLKQHAEALESLLQSDRGQAPAWWSQEYEQGAVEKKGVAGHHAAHSSQRTAR